MSDNLNTPTPWYILEIPEHPDQYFIAAKPTPDHPYSGHTRNIDIAGDEDYPRKRADCELIVRAINSHDALVEALELSIGWMKMMQGWNPFGNGPSDEYLIDLNKAEAALLSAKGEIGQ